MRADVVERDVRPALDAGSVVVMERFVDSPLAHLSAVAGLAVEEFEGLADWATGQVRPDITVLLDADPGTRPQTSAPEAHWRVQHLLAEMPPRTRIDTLWSTRTARRTRSANGCRRRCARY